MFDTLARRLKAYETYRRTYSELSRLNTRELADIGLTRDGIKAVARDRAGV
jgi:uncharacterized protein YjiS (DUF1127 family)